jgi:hypothetical protein
MRKFITDFLTAVTTVMLLSNATAVSAAGDPFLFPEKNFETPEAAIQHFVERLAANDLSGALEACAINEGDRFDFAYNAKRIGALFLLNTEMPVNSPMAGQINRIKRLNYLTQQIRFMMTSITTDVKIDGSVQGINPTDEQIVAFVNSSDFRKLAGLAIVKITPPTSGDILESERAIEGNRAQARTYKGDDTIEKVVLYKLGKEYFWGGFHLFRFGKYWRIDSLVSYFANTPSLGVVQRTTPEQFDDAFEPHKEDNSAD